MNKFVAVFCLVASALGSPDAEADPYYTFGYQGLHHGLYNYGAPFLRAAYSPLVTTGYNTHVVAAPAVVAPAVAAPAVTAPAVATPAVTAPVAIAPSVTATYHHVAPVVSGIAAVSHGNSVSIAGTAPPAVPVAGGAYASAGRYVANSAGTVHVAKRSADAEADPYYAFSNFHTYGTGFPYYTGYTGYLPHVPAVHHVTGYASGLNSANSVTHLGHAPAAVPAVPGAYAGAGRYCAHSAGVTHCA